MQDFDVNTLDVYGNTALYWAILCHHVSIVRYLLDRGAKFDLNTVEGNRYFLAAQNPKVREILRLYPHYPGRKELGSTTTTTTTSGILSKRQSQKQEMEMEEGMLLFLSFLFPLSSFLSFLSSSYSSIFPSNKDHFVSWHATC
jgi:ankyrin repeat protein